MKRNILKKYVANAVVALAMVLGVSSFSLGASSTVSKEKPPAKDKPATQPAQSQSKLQKAAELRDQGLDKALAGKFTAAMAKLQEASKIAPGDNTTKQAIELLSGYMKRIGEIKSERLDEYNYEIKRIGWVYIAQDYMDELGKKPYCKKFRNFIKKDLIDAYHAIGTSEVLEDSTAEEGEKLKKTSLTEIEKAYQATQNAIATLKGNDSKYAKSFCQQADTLKQRLDEIKTVWQNIDPSTPKSRWAGSQKLMIAEANLADAATDVEVMVTKTPWKMALLHGRIARELAPDKEAMAKSKWYVDLLKDAETRGKNAVEKAKWYDALSAYSALEDLDPENEKYKAEVDKVRRHVRVLRLYGKEKDKAEDSGENSDDGEDADDGEEAEDAEEDQAQSNEPVWKEMVEGVDAQMVRKAISKLRTSYVKAVDYGKLTRGALQAVKILAQTPQVAEMFPGLKDEAKRKNFVASIDKELAEIEHHDRIDHIRLQMALNRVLASNEDSVNIPLEVLVVEFADGFLGELDKFSNMIWPFDVINFNKSTMGQFTGIGVQITKEPGKPLKVVTPLLGTPAFKAGIKAGDLITEVDGQPTKKKTIDKLVKKIMGPPGSTVMLTIKRRGVAEPMKVPVVRQAVHIRTVKGWQRKKDGDWTFELDHDKKIGYIRITQFTGTTHDNIYRALKKLKASGITSLVLDLRGNPGGLLRSATRVANEFLSAGRIVYTRGWQVARSEINADKSGRFLNGDLVVLVDQNSASAAEILSGAIKDWNRGKIIGQRSYGKGSVQNVIPVRRNEAFLKLTTAYYYLPSGRLLHRQNHAKDWGVVPDVDVYISPNQMRRWLQFRRKTDLLQDFVPELLAADLEKQYNADVQLNTAVLMLELMKIKRQAEQNSKDWVAAES